jgi:CMP-N-acetylneuraminic acid synthetase
LIEERISDESIAVIPVREGSQRVMRKNFRPFASESSLLALKIRQLKKEGCFHRIYVSSDSSLAKSIAHDMDVEFLPRAPYLCSNTVRWSEVIAGVVESIPGQNPMVSWVHTTSPLHTSYKTPLELLQNDVSGFDSLVAVSIFQEFLIRENGRPFNYDWGPWHDYSQDLEKLYRVTGALFIARKQDILSWKYLIGIHPLLYSVDKHAAIDVDTEEDFAFAESFFTGPHALRS